MPYFICPNCRRRSIDHDRLEDLTNEAVVCDRNRRILALGQGVFELTGFREKDVLGLDVTKVFSLEADGDANPADVALEWGVRQLGKSISIRTRSGVTKIVRADFFPAYDEDGGLLVALVPRQAAGNSS